ncbi:hypothetical protein OERS_39830 [Oerskovia enterophila]|uniref:Uncharacterized protein n=1 Tax=Oerskovia enterophila TaxID=43678 RepID=A0ABX2XYF9_9CELL|nr:hypothetical protein OERS_39830 [Oerskovia enterophila]
MVRPPIHAPSALPTLNAAMLAPEAMVGAACAWPMMRIWRPGTVANPNAPMRTSETTVMTWLVAVSAKTARITVSAPRIASRLVVRKRSAALPPR